MKQRLIFISGASSVPALSGAVVRHLAGDITQVHAVEIAITASNRAAAGPAVAASILSQVGQPMPMWQGKRWIRRFGWQGHRKLGFQVAGPRTIGGRLIGLVDVPDLALLPDRLPGRPAIVFRAGTELGFHNLGLWFASWLVRWGVADNLTGLAGWLRPLQRPTAAAGTDRSAMVMRAFSRIETDRIERQWTLSHYGPCMISHPKGVATNGTRSSTTEGRASNEEQFCGASRSRRVALRGWRHGRHRPDQRLQVQSRRVG